MPTNPSILGELRFNKIDYICEDITSLTGGFVWTIGKGLLGDLGDMDFSAIKNKSRSRGDLNMIMNVLQLVGNDNNSEIVSKIAYGLGTSDGISLGLWHLVYCAILTNICVKAFTFTLNYLNMKLLNPFFCL